MEHLRCLKIFRNDFALLTQVDGFSLTDSVSIFMSCVIFDRGGDVTMGDTQRGTVWSLGKAQYNPQSHDCRQQTQMC